MAEANAQTRAAAGRVCPTDYRLDWSATLAGTPESADVLYVVGGLYGNPFALAQIETLFAAEKGQAPRMAFNGDFHWFDIEPGMFADVDERVFRHDALRGNVETEIAAGRSAEIGCGCAYPESVSDETVAWSNEIMGRLARTAERALGPRVAGLASLPAVSMVSVGECRVGITHGDDLSLAGWGLAEDQLERSIADGLGDRLAALTLDVLASSHTCLPVARGLGAADGRRISVINNGSAGMANFKNDPRGLITRVALESLPPPVPPLYEARLAGGVVLQAIPVAFDQVLWMEAFTRMWPRGSAAFTSYFGRISEGPRYRIDQAVRHGFHRQTES